MALADYLARDGYRRVPLARNGLGHFHAAGSLDGRPVAVLIDTGAASTLVSLALARELGLALVKLPITGGGAGGTNLEIFHAPNAQLTLGDVVLRPRALMAMDLAHVNQALAMKGESPVEAILGVDVFDTQAAVIDYGSSSLFLKE